MANAIQLARLKEDVAAWNNWRAKNLAVLLDLEDANLKWAKLRRANLQGANLRRANLQEANLQRTGLHGADLEEAVLLRTNLQEAVLRGANVERADLRGADLEEADLREANLRGAHLREAHLRRAILQDADLEEADLGGTNLGGARLGEAILRGAHLRDANLQEAVLRGADLREADLRWARLQLSFLEDALLHRAVLKEANLGGADLRRAVLKEANLQGVVLDGAVLQDAVLVQADLTGADLSNSIGVVQQQLDDARGDHRTQIPKDLRRPEHWQVREPQISEPATPDDPPPGNIQTKLIPVKMDWRPDGKVDVAPPLRTDSPLAEDEGFRKSLLRAQSIEAVALTQRLEQLNMPPATKGVVQRYADTCNDGEEDCNFLHLDTLYRNLEGYIASAQDELSSSETSAFQALFDNHKVLRTLFPEYQEFLDRLGNRKIDEEKAEKPLNEAIAGVTDPPVEEVIASKARQAAIDEAQQRDKTKAVSSSLALVTQFLKLLSNPIAAASGLMDKVSTLIKRFEKIEAQLEKLEKEAEPEHPEDDESNP